MPEYESLSGKELTWECRKGYPLDVRVAMSTHELGRLWRKDGGERGCLARMAGINWSVSEKPGFVHPSYHLGFPDGHCDLGVATFDLRGRVSVRIDGTRTYRLDQSSIRVSSWRTDGHDAMIFQRHGSTLTLPMNGTIVVGPDTPSVDGPPLIVLGLMLAFEQRLFLSDPGPGNP